MKNTLAFARPVVAAIGLFALGAIPAHAADVIYDEPPMPAAPMEEPPLNTWSGPYAGVTLGYAWGDTEVDGGIIVSNSIDTDGFNAGGFVGYNYQVGNIVAGAEADLGYSFADGEDSGFESESGIEGSLRARLGYTITPNILLYATAGGAAKQLEVSGNGTDDDNTMIGYTAGAGADVMVTEQVFGRVEYRYTDFGSEDFGTAEVDDKDHRVLFGLGVKF